jgi:hypothetical protein
MSKRKRILTGILALSVGLSIAMPMRASAENVHHERDHHRHGWLWEKYEDHYRARPDDRGDAYRNRPGYAYGNRPLSANGQGMINERNPNLYWACNSEGHHCHWAPRS